MRIDPVIGPLPELSTLFHDGFRAAFMDGHAEFIRKDTDEAALRALITRDGGESLTPDPEGVFRLRAGGGPGTTGLAGPP